MPDVFDAKKVGHDNAHKAEFNQVTSQEAPEKHDPKKVLKIPEGMERHQLEGHNHNPLSAFCYYPDNVSFVNEDPEEKVILLLRKHPITNVVWLSIVFLMIIAPSFLSVISPFEFLPPGFQIILTLVWYLITTAFTLEQFLSWFFHVNIITDERIIEVDFVNLLYREITDANLDQIQDVTVEVGGALRTFLHFGDVVIQTAAQVPKIEFEAVPNPDKVARVLRELRIEEEQEKLEGRVR